MITGFELPIRLRLYGLRERIFRRGAREPIGAVNRIEIQESGEPLVNVRNACANIQVRPQVCPYLRRTVCDMLNRAQAMLPQEHTLCVSAALRTLDRQKELWDAYFQHLTQKYAWLPASSRRWVTNTYFAPYDQHAPPGHCTGGAVDVELLGRDGEPLEVGQGLSYTWTNRISKEARRNRMILVQAMLDAGFSNCREEFWHYSYGDSAWAVRVGKKACPYGLIDPPVSAEAPVDPPNSR
jgi:D-alanyl-D-alanine dipeptidase